MAVGAHLAGATWSKPLRAILHVVLPLFGRVEIIGAEHVKERGQLLVCDHVGWADPIWLAYAVHPRLLHQMAKEELFQWPWAARVIEALGAFPVNRARPSTATIRYAAELLRAGELVLIFPAGTRDRGQTADKRGAALIAAMAQAPLVRVRYEGPPTIRLEHLMSRPKIVIRFGP